MPHGLKYRIGRSDTNTRKGSGCFNLLQIAQWNFYASLNIRKSIPWISQNILSSFTILISFAWSEYSLHMLKKSFPLADRESDHNNTLLRLLFWNWLAFEHGDQTSSPPACYKEHIFGKEGCQQLQAPLQVHYKSAFIRMYHRSHPLQKMSTVENEEVHFPKKSIQLSSL